MGIVDTVLGIAGFVLAALNAHQAIVMLARARRTPQAVRWRGTHIAEPRMRAYALACVALFWGGVGASKFTRPGTGENIVFVLALGALLAAAAVEITRRRRLSDDSPAAPGPSAGQ